MEIFLVLAVVLGLWWAFKAKGASQGALRYQAHKDALEEGRRLLERFHHRETQLTHEIVDHFDVRRVPLENREILCSDLEDIAIHVRSTQIPHDLGAHEPLRELLEVLRRAKAFANDDVTPEGRRKLRVRFMDEAFKRLQEQAAGFDPKGLIGVDGDLRALKRQIRACKEALTWKTAGEEVTVRGAEQILRAAREVVKAQAPSTDES